MKIVIENNGNTRTEYTYYFNSETDELNLVNYIKKAQKVSSKEKITKILLAKNWNKKQVEYSFKKAAKK